MSACHCNPEPTCNRPALRAEIVTREQEFYGFLDFSQAVDVYNPAAPGINDPRQRYLTRTDSYEYGSGGGSTSRSDTYDPVTGDITTVGSGSGVAVPQGYVDSWSFTDFSGHYGTEAGDDPADDHFTAALTIENTRAAVRTIARDHLPEWTGEFTNPEGVFFPVAKLEDDGGSDTVTAQALRYYYLVSPPGGCRLKAKWKERFTPTDEEAEVVDTERSAEWVGTGNPCYGPDFRWDDPTTWPKLDDDGTGYYEILPPEEPGVISIEDFWWTCVPGATPTGPNLPDSGASGPARLGE